MLLRDRHSEPSRGAHDDALQLCEGARRMSRMSMIRTTCWIIDLDLVQTFWNIASAFFIYRPGLDSYSSAAPISHLVYKPR